MIFFRRTLPILALALCAARARADCTPETRVSPCIDADPLWVPASPTPFVVVPSARALAQGAWSAGASVTYLARPITIVAASPDPKGREIRVLDDVFDGSVHGAYAPTPHLELLLAVPFTIARTGTGVGGITTQAPTSAGGAALGDVRVGAGHDLFAARSDDLVVHGMSRLQLALPTGGDLAGSRGPTLAPSFVFDGSIGAFDIATEHGLRLRAASDLGGTRLGSQWLSSLGIAFRPLAGGRLAFALEAFFLPSLVPQRHTLPDGTRAFGTLVPAEWMFSLRARPATELTLKLGAGTSIPLSEETKRRPDGTETSDTFAGMTSPRFRAVLVVTYVPEVTPR